MTCCRCTFLLLGFWEACGTSLKFPTLVVVAAFQFQQNVIKTMMQVENTFHALAEHRRQNVLLICDRGVMDGSACKFV